MKKKRWYCRTPLGGGCGKGFPSPQRLAAHVSAARRRGKTRKQYANSTVRIGAVVVPESPFTGRTTT